MKLSLVLVSVVLVNADFDKEEGDSCGPDDSWDCQALGDCVTAKIKLKQNIRPEVCSFGEDTTIVCCEPDSFLRLMNATTPKPPENLGLKRSVSELMCENYSQYVFEYQDNPVEVGGPKQLIDQCGWITVPLIAGGVDVDQKEYPHMVQIGYGKPSDGDYLCGGSLVSERWVVTAAHCTRLKDNGTTISPSFVRMGDVAPNDNTDKVTPIVVNIIEMIDHPQYNPAELYNDIALYKLESDVKFTPHIRPICLQVDDPVITKNKPTAIGFGHTHFGGQVVDRLQKVSLSIVDTALCNTSFTEGNKVQPTLPHGISEATMICAGGELGKDTCMGDSGSSLQIQLKWPYCMYSLIGVTSFGKVCANRDPGVYSKVSAFAPWIEDIVWPAEKAKWNATNAKLTKNTGLRFPNH